MFQSVYIECRLNTNPVKFRLFEKGITHNCRSCKKMSQKQNFYNCRFMLRNANKWYVAIFTFIQDMIFGCARHNAFKIGFLTRIRKSVAITATFFQENKIHDNKLLVQIDVITFVLCCNCAVNKLYQIN